MSALSERSKNDPNRHPGVAAKDCNCGLIHDDELLGSSEKREKVLDFLGRKCSNPKCRWMNEDGTLGCKDERLLQVDHVYDDGFLDRKTKKQTASYWTRVLYDLENGSDRYQILCANCNWMKRLRSGSWAIKFGEWKSKEGVR